ncbi:MAG: preprotein translocase subunit YajC, partial [Rikenellaceae bacterium]
MNTLFVTMQAQGGSGWSSLLMIGALFVVMYFFMIRPQQKKQKELAKFRDSLQKGDKILTAGGIYATVK